MGVLPLVVSNLWIANFPVGRVQVLVRRKLIESKGESNGIG